MLEQEYLHVTKWGKLGYINANAALDAFSLPIHVCFHHTSPIYSLLPGFQHLNCQHTSAEEGVMGDQRLAEEAVKLSTFPRIRGASC